jgi:hypothetical protein
MMYGNLVHDISVSLLVSLHAVAGVEVERSEEDKGLPAQCEGRASVYPVSVTGAKVIHEKERKKLMIQLCSENGMNFAMP